MGVAVSYDGEFLATCGKDRLIKVWDAKTCQLKETFKGHRDEVLGVAFRYGTHELYSVSSDRTVKMWNCDSMAYLDTLYGHQASITDLDVMRKERCITSSMDNTSRLWKIPEETQLVLRGSKSSLDCVAFIKDDLWITGSQGGSLDLWSIQKKKPIFTVEDAHGRGNWISAVATVHQSDLAASGSCNGTIKLWKISQKQIIHIKDISLVGWINALAFSTSGSHLVAGVGQEHKLGRWNTVKKSKNGVAVICILVPQGSK
eukprot:TRINITY_DN11378_c0_g1_i1.p1 TRINITY_DN11378_c0_g1~~TRINITY_DN11378_c0_g1_i1.p1  ORF type:complete len:284 (-),score=58.12 TRINITY_DN11378_c0_g1_i1:58-834(-)